MISHIIETGKRIPPSCWRPDTILQLSSATSFAFQFAHPTLGATYSMYKEGSFWSRSWEQSGAKPSAFGVKFPVVVLVPDFGSVEDRKTICTSYNLLVADTPDCDTCGECKRSAIQVEEDLKKLLAYYIAKLSERSLIRDVEDNIYWVSRETLVQLKVGRQVKCVIETLDPTWGDIKTLPINRDNSIWVGVEFKLCDCLLENFLEVDYIIPTKKGDTKCETC